MLTQINDDCWFDLAEVAGVQRNVSEPEVVGPGLIRAAGPPKYYVLTRAGKSHLVTDAFRDAVLQKLAHHADYGTRELASWAGEKTGRSADYAEPA